MAISNTHSRWDHGALVFYNDENEQRWLNVIGDNVIKYTNDFEVCPHTTAAANDANCPEWIVTHTSGGVGNSGMTAADIAGGGLKIYAASSDDDGLNIQLRNKTFKIKANSPLYFGVRWRIDNATQSDCAMGLCETDTSIAAGIGDGVYIGTTDGGTYVKLHCVDGLTSDKTLVGTTGLAADTMMVDEFIAESTAKISYWHNGTFIGSLTAAIPSTAMMVSFAYVNGASSMAGEGIIIDWVRCFQIVATRAT